MLPLNFNHLYYFYIVAQRGSFSDAARELRISQSSISVQIKQLENSLGHKLFDRVKTGVELTESGQIAAQFAADIFENVGRIQEELDAVQYRISGHLTIGTVNSVGIYLLPDAVREFNYEYPEVKVAIDFKSPRELVESVRAGRTDFAILTSNRQYAGLTNVPLRKNKMFLVTPPNHPLATGNDVSPADLEKYPFIGYEEGMESRMMIDAMFRRMALSVEYTVESSNVATIKHMVLAGLGIAILPETVVGDEIRRGLLARPSLPSLYMVQEITLYYKTNRSSTPAREKFAQLIRVQLGTERRTKR